MASNVARNSPVVMATLEKHFEHISLMAQEQLEVEFREEIAQLMQMQQMMQQNPNATKSADATTDDVTINEFRV